MWECPLLAPLEFVTERTVARALSYMQPITEAELVGSAGSSPQEPDVLGAPSMANLQDAAAPSGASENGREEEEESLSQRFSELHTAEGAESRGEKQV